MIRVGITGSIGSGKTTVCRMFAALGIPVYDSDLEARRLMQEPPLARRIAERFGDAMYRDGVLDRRALAARVFSDPNELVALNALVHPVVVEDFRRWTAEQRAPYLILESALLFEAGLQQDLDYVVVVTAPITSRVLRAQRRDGVSTEEVRRRMAAQMTEEEYMARADFVIRNDSDLIALDERVAQLNSIFTHAK